MGWTATYPTANWGGTPTVSFGEIVVTSGIVYQAYIDKKAADIQKIADDKAAAATAAAKKDATSMTTCAAALFATMYALSFWAWLTPDATDWLLKATCGSKMSKTMMAHSELASKPQRSWMAFKWT